MIWEDISRPLRAERYRQFAAETLRLARAAETSEIKVTYLSLAACWKKLAEKVDGSDLDGHQFDEDGNSTLSAFNGN